MKKLSLLCFAAALAIFGCDKKTVPTQPPEMYIDLPVGFNSSSFTTTKPIINLSATCSNWASVEITNESTGKIFKTINKNPQSDDCTIEGVELVEGDNKLHGVVKAGISAGLQAYGMVTVTLNKTVDFLEMLTLSQNSAHEGISNIIFASVNIKADSNIKSVQLVAPDNGSYKQITQLSPITQDNITLYSGSFNTGELVAGNQPFRVIAQNKGVMNYSTTANFEILGQDALNKIRKNHETCNELWQTYFNGRIDNMSINDKVKYMRSMADTIKKSPNVLNVDISNNADLVIVFDNTYCVHLPDRQKNQVTDSFSTYFME